MKASGSPFEVKIDEKKRTSSDLPSSIKDSHQFSYKIQVLISITQYSEQHKKQVYEIKIQRQST